MAHKTHTDIVHLQTQTYLKAYSIKRISLKKH